MSMHKEPSYGGRMSMKMNYDGGLSKYIGSNIRKTQFYITSNQVITIRGLKLRSKKMGGINTGT